LHVIRATKYLIVTSFAVVLCSSHTANGRCTVSPNGLTFREKTSRIFWWRARWYHCWIWLYRTFGWTYMFEMTNVNTTLDTTSAIYKHIASAFPAVALLQNTKIFYEMYPIFLRIM